VDECKPLITGLDAAKLAAEVEELKTTVGWLHEKLGRVAACVEELEARVSTRSLFGST
jgi:hypothetical protein